MKFNPFLGPAIVFGGVCLALPTQPQAQAIAGTNSGKFEIIEPAARFQFTRPGQEVVDRLVGSPQLFMRTFRVDPAAFRVAMDNLRAQSGQVAKASDSHSSEVAMAKDFFHLLGVDGDSPPGKSVFFNERLGILFVKATENDLDTIERALPALNPAPSRVALKARFVEFSPGDSEWGFDWDFDQFPASVTAESTTAPTISILTNPNFQATWHALQSRSDVEILGEPEIVTLSGRQTQMKATRLHNYVIGLKATSLHNYIGDFPPYHNGDPIHEGHDGFGAMP